MLLASWEQRSVLLFLFRLDFFLFSSVYNLIMSGNCHISPTTCTIFIGSNTVCFHKKYDMTGADLYRSDICTEDLIYVLYALIILSLG